MTKYRISNQDTRAERIRAFLQGSGVNTGFIEILAYDNKALLLMNSTEGASFAQAISDCLKDAAKRYSKKNIHSEISYNNLINRLIRNAEPEDQAILHDMPLKLCYENGGLVLQFASPAQADLFKNAGGFSDSRLPKLPFAAPEHARFNKGRCEIDLGAVLLNNEPSAVCRISAEENTRFYFKTPESIEGEMLTELIIIDTGLLPKLDLKLAASSSQSSTRHSNAAASDSSDEAFLPALKRKMKRSVKAIGEGLEDGWAYLQEQSVFKKKAETKEQQELQLVLKK